MNGGGRKRELPKLVVLVSSEDEFDEMKRRRNGGRSEPKFRFADRAGGDKIKSTETAMLNS
jgi:hypothetical protein